MREDVLRYEIIHRLDELVDRLAPSQATYREHDELRELALALRHRLAGFGLMELHEPEEQP